MLYSLVTNVLNFQNESLVVIDHVYLGSRERYLEFRLNLNSIMAKEIS